MAIRTGQARPAPALFQAPSRTSESPGNKSLKGFPAYQDQLQLIVEKRLIQPGQAFLTFIPRLIIIRKNGVDPPMVTRLRKTRKLRASRTHGWGRSGQHRGSGSQGGHGNAGWKRHRWSAVIRYGIVIGKTGFTSTNHRYSRFINVGALNQQIDRFLQDGFARETGGKIEVDLGRAGYTKLLGDGGVDKALRVIVYQASEKAAEKIRESGGEVVLPTQTKED